MHPSTRWTVARPDPTSALVTAIGLAALLAVSILLRTAALGQEAWIDEALSIGIASHPLADIPSLLRQDGSPPLYYLLLHVWMAIAGDGDSATGAFSLVFALATIPAALWAGTSLAGRRAGWLGAAVAAFIPFLETYGQETRMYSLVVLLSLLATACALHVFLHGRRGPYLAGLAVTLTLLLYTHNWGLLLFAALGLLAAYTLVSSPRRDRRTVAAAAVIGLGLPLIAFTPWLPTLAYQAAHTGAPWSDTPDLADLWSTWKSILGGVLPATLLTALLLATVITPPLRRRAGLRAAGEVDTHGQDPPATTGPRAHALHALHAGIAITAAITIAAFALAQLEPNWAARYFAVIVGPLILTLGMALADARWAGLAALAVAVVVWIGHDPPRMSDYSERDLGRAAAAALSPGDLVVSTHPERVPALERYMPDGLRYATPLGPVADARVVDWRDAVKRLESAGVPGSVAGALDHVPPGGRVALVTPLTGIDSQWEAPWTRLVRRRSNAWLDAMRRDPRFTPRATFPDNPERLDTGVRAQIYERR